MQTPVHILLAIETISSPFRVYKLFRFEFLDSCVFLLQNLVRVILVYIPFFEDTMPRSNSKTEQLPMPLLLAFESGPLFFFYTTHPFTAGLIFQLQSQKTP